MKFCIYCGKQLHDEAKFCTNCGAKVYAPVSARTSDDGEGIVIDAPEDATVTISEVHETKAPDTTGEFVISSWSNPDAQSSEGDAQSSEGDAQSTEGNEQ
ncbi:MAG: zinc ribbon domain-containing protein [Bacteroidaceae bacterium]|nr:zinc ribbon domain-containing protein [Bacteroidaceae bacterium]